MGALGPIFDWDAIFQIRRNGRCAQTVRPRSKISSSVKPPYWVVLTPLSNQNSTKNIYGPVSKFSHSYTLKKARVIVILIAFLKKNFYYFSVIPNLYITCLRMAQTNILKPFKLLAKLLSHTMLTNSFQHWDLVLEYHRMVKFPLNSF